MNYTQLDTVSFKVPLTAVNSYDARKFRPHTFKTSGREVEQLTAADLKTPGLNLIRIDKIGGENGEGEAVIEVSAKLLGRHYPEYITANTVESVLQRINAVAPIQLDTAAALDTAAPLKLHTGRNLTLTAAPARYLSLLQLLHINPSYTATLHRNGNTLAYSKNVGTSKAQEYVKFYNKTSEFEKLNNKLFRDSLAAADLTQIRQQFQGKMRLEDEQNSVTKIRQRYNMPQGQPVKLTDILTSPVNTLAKVFNKLTANIAQHPEQVEERLFFAGLTTDEQAVMGQCKLFDYHMPTIKDVCFQNVSRPTRTKKLKAAASLVSRLQAQRGAIQDTDFALLDELRHQILVHI